MKAFALTEQKAFMSLLLIKEVFDRFALSELILQSSCRLQIDGKRNVAFYSQDELDALPEQGYVLWSEVKPHVYQMIRGNKTPSFFRIVFRLTKENTANVLASIGSSIEPQEVGGLFINLQYEREQLTVVSGVAFQTFQKDRTLETAWDSYVERFLKKNEISYTN